MQLFTYVGVRFVKTLSARSIAGSRRAMISTHSI